MKAIAAMACNRVIGLHKGIPWHNKEDFKWFKEFTLGKTLVVGRTTAETLPVLPNRQVLVLTRGSYRQMGYDPIRNYSLCTVSYAEVMEAASRREVVIAGGAQIYDLFLPKITEFYVSHIDCEPEGDVYMPNFESELPIKHLVREFDKGKVFKYTRE